MSGPTHAPLFVQLFALSQFGGGGGRQEGGISPGAQAQINGPIHLPAQLSQKGISHEFPVQPAKPKEQCLKVGMSEKKNIIKKILKEKYMNSYLVQHIHRVLQLHYKTASKNIQTDHNSFQSTQNRKNLQKYICLEKNE